MKTKFVFIQILVLAALSIHAFAGSPYNNEKGTNTKMDCVDPSPTPPSPWYITIDVMDTSCIHGCSALTNPTGCGTEFVFEIDSPTTCQAIAAPTYTIPFVYCTMQYTQAIPDTVKCVLVSVSSNSPTTCPVNSNTCCKIRGDTTPCKLKICP